MVGGIGRNTTLLLVLVLAISSCSVFGRSENVPHSWALTDSHENTLTILVVVGSSSCDDLQEVAVTETAGDVTITAIVEEQIPGSGILGKGCTDDLTTQQVEVVLEAPLGNRELSGCSPGVGGLEDYFDSTGMRSSGDCTEVVDWRPKVFDVEGRLIGVGIRDGSV